MATGSKDGGVMGPDAAQVVKLGDPIPEDDDEACRWCGDNTMQEFVPDEARDEGCCSWRCFALLVKEMHRAAVGEK